MKFKSLILVLKASALAMMAFAGWQGTASADTGKGTTVSTSVGPASALSALNKTAAENKNSPVTLASSKGLRINPACDDGGPCPPQDDAS